MTDDSNNNDVPQKNDDDGVIESSGSDGSFGMGSIGAEGNTMGGQTNVLLDDDAIDSSIPRLKLGVNGLDDMIQGGIPKQSLVVVVGEPGTGKTTFAMQFLQEALDNDERAVYITLEEGKSQLVRSAGEKGFEFGRYVDDKQLAVISYNPIEMKNSLTSIEDTLPSLITDFGATRLVIDSVSLLEMMYDGDGERRNEIYEFLRSLQDAGITTLLTSEASKEHDYTSRYGIIEYVTDAWFMLKYVRSDSFSETRMAVEIQKIRDTNHSRAVRPYDLTNDGMEVYTNSSFF